MANTKLPARLLDTSAIPALNVTGDLTVDTTTLKVDSTNNRVGIGIASPAHPFHITKELAGYQAYFNNDNGSAQGIKVRIKSNDSGNFNMLELVSASTGSDVTAMVVRDDGNVGIGEISPDLPLHVSGTVALPATSGSTPTGFISLRAKTAGGSHGLHMGVSNASPWGSWLQAQDANNLATEYPLLLNPNGGNVGIGTDSPAAGLQVSRGLTNAGGPAAGASTASACFGNDGSDDNYGLVLGADGNGLGYISAQRTDGTATAYPLVIQHTGGNVGIGDVAPGAKLSVGAGNASTYVHINNAASGDVSSGLNIMSGSTTTTSLYGNADEGWTTLLSGGSIGFRVNNAVSGFNPMNIDTSGRVTMPYQPAFCVYNPPGVYPTSSTSSAFGKNWTGNSYSTHANAGSHFSTTTGRFTAPVAGSYYFSISFMVDSNTGNNTGFDIRKNGVALNGGEGLDIASAAPGYTQIAGSILITLAVNDYVDAQMRGGGRIHQRYGSFEGFLIG